MKMLCKIFFLLAVGVCGYTLVTEDEAFTMTTESLQNPNKLGRSASMPNMKIGGGGPGLSLDMSKVVRAGGEEVLNSARSLVENGAKDLIMDEWEEIECAGNTFIAGVQTVKDAMSIVSDAYEMGQTTGGQKQLVVEGGAQMLKQANGFSVNLARSAKAAAKGVAIAAIADGGMVSGPAAVTLLGVGWVASKFADGAFDETEDQVNEIIDQGKARFVDVEGNEREVIRSPNEGKILVKKTRTIQKYTPEKRREIERQLMTRGYGGVGDMITEIAHVPEELIESPKLQRTYNDKEKRKQKRMEMERELMQSMENNLRK